jgi:hypothetical protein
MDNITWTDRVKNEKVFQSIKEEKNILVIKRNNVNWIGYSSRTNCLVKDVTEGKIKGRIEVTKWRESRRKQLLVDLKKTR